MFPVFPSPADEPPEAGAVGVDEIQAALAQVRRQQMQLAQRERQLLQALAGATRGRIREMVETSGVAAPDMEDLLRRAVDSSRRGRGSGANPSGRGGAGSSATSAASADRVRKAPLRFRHPEEPALVWSGRGKTPRWVLELQAQGRLDQARVPNEEG
jgi:DNA-binding protein H-NS